MLPSHTIARPPTRTLLTQPLQVVPPAYLNLAVWDTHAPTAQQIETGVQWALAQRAAGRPVLVHCAHGHGRSATVLAAILIGGWVVACRV